MREWDEAHDRADIHVKARNQDQHRTYLLFKWWCEDNGADICHVIISQMQGCVEGF
jgi:hypothetical protein